MDDKMIHDLAIAYAQVKLIQFQQEHPDRNMTDEELCSFLKSYNYARCQLPIEYDGLDEPF